MAPMRAFLLAGALILAAFAADPILHRPASERVAKNGGGVGEAPDANCPQSPTSLPPLPSPLPAVLQAALDGVAAQFQSLITGAGGGVVSGGALEVRYGAQTLLSLSAGVANASSGLPWAPSTPTRVASVSKLLPSVLLFLLRDAGALRSLDEPVSALCPQFSALNPFDAANVSWRHLATQTSGLQREAPAGEASMTTDEALALVAQTYLVAPPGARPSYSNLGFAVLGHLLAECVVPAAAAAAAAAGGLGALSSLALPTDLPSLVEALITRPLGISATTLYVPAGSVPPQDVLGKMAAGYLPGGAEVPQEDLDLGWWFPAGSAVSSAADLATLGAALLSAAAIAPAAPAAAPPPPALALSPASAREMLLPSIRSSGDGSYLQGSPWEVRPRVPSNETAAGAAGGDLPPLDPAALAALGGAGQWLVLNKGGNLPGYTALVSLLPSLGLVVSAAFNGAVDEFALSDGIADAVAPALASALGAILAPSKDGSVGPSPASLYAGPYGGGLGGDVLVQALTPDAGPLAYVWTSAGQTQRISFYLDFFARGLAPPPYLAAYNFSSVTMFRAFIPPPGQLPAGALSCTDDAMLAIRGQYVLFGMRMREAEEGGGGGNEVPVATGFPGVVPGVVFLAPGGVEPGSHVRRMR